LDYIFSGVLVPGGFGNRGIEGKIQAIEWARKNQKPFLGVCLGLQCAVVEFARNVLGWTDANSTELIPETTKPVVIDMPEHTGGDLGGTMRVGKRETIFTDSDSIIKALYGNRSSIEERHRHRYEVNPQYINCFNEAGMKFVGHDSTGNRMEIMELSNHPYFVGVQYHPEYLSRPLKPSPPYLGLLLASSGKLSSYISRGYRLSPRQGSDYDTSDDDFIIPNSESTEFSKTRFTLSIASN
jgi:CTP synthase